jgi:hypothetical protein
MIEDAHGNPYRTMGKPPKTMGKSSLILEAIAKKENIPVDNEMPRKVMEFLLREANWG